jgi:hypothetical protein
MNPPSAGNFGEFRIIFRSIFIGFQRVFYRKAELFTGKGLRGGAVAGTLRKSQRDGLLARK